MPVYLFTFHAYRSWMPDHPRGYTSRQEGVLPPDPQMASNYARRAKHQPFQFDDETSAALIVGLIQGCPMIDVRLHAAATEPTHVHSLVSWKHDRSWLSVRKSLKTALTKILLARDPRSGFARGASRKRVKDNAHFSYLVGRYLPDHSGIAWYEDGGWVHSRKTR